MHTIADVAPVSKGALWGGRAMSALPVMMLLFSAAGKLLSPPGMAEGFERLGYPLSLALGLGILELGCTVVYLIPRTAVLGAILVTGYLGGAVATHVRVGDPMWMVVIPVVLGVLAWGGLWLRDPRVRMLIPLRG